METVYVARSNPNTITISQDGVYLDFSTITRMTLSFDGSELEADTSVSSGLIDWSQGLGVVEFSINDLGLPTGRTFSSTLVAYDPLHPLGQVLIHSRDNVLKFRFIES